MPKLLPSLVVFVALSACQNYRFEAVSSQPVTIVNQQVTIKAKQNASSVMIVQDTSGSMCEAITLGDDAGTACVSTTGSFDPNYCSFCQEGDSSPAASSADCNFQGANQPLPACATKMQLTAFAVNGALGQLSVDAGQLNMGLAAFPDVSQGGCAAGTVIVPVKDATLTISQIESFYSGIANSPGGGTPTAATLLGAVASDPAMSNPDPSVAKYVLLITDGLPNCDSQNACATEAWSDGKVHGCASQTLLAQQGVNAIPPPGCSCSFGDCANVSNGNTCCPVNSGSTPPAWYCLDGQGAVAAVSSLLQNQQIKTIVVGMGFDYQGLSNASTVLDDMMAAGGSGLNNGLHYQANDPGTLVKVVQSLIAEISGPTCDYQLDAPPANPNLITVTLGGTNVPNDPTNGFTLDSSGGQITIHGSYCAQIQSGSGGELQITAIAQ